MPLNDYRCRLCGYIEERFVPLAQLYEMHFHQHPAGCVGAMEIVHLSPPMVRGDLPPYESPVTGTLIQGRAARREDLKRHDCVEWESGLRADCKRKRQQESEQLDRSIDNTIDSEIAKMPTRKRELLEQGAREFDIEVTRSIA